MKTATQRILSLTTVFALAFLMVAGTGMAKEKSKEQKMFEKQKEVVETAGPTDWKVLAKAANKLIKKETHLDDAKAWLDRSLKIYQDPYNLEAMGDYFEVNGDKQKALEYYVKALEIGAKDYYFNPAAVQDKITKLKS